MQNSVKASNTSPVDAFAANGSLRAQVVTVTPGTVWRVDPSSLGAGGAGTYTYGSDFEAPVQLSLDVLRVVPVSVTEITFDKQYLIEFAGEMKVKTKGTPPA